MKRLKLNKRNALVIAGAVAVLLLLIFLPSGRKRGDGGVRVKGINRVLVNEMSELPELEGLDKSIKSFMQRWYVKGMQLSITKNGALVYSKGYGWADKEKDLQMGPGNILRVASVSKLITAAGIMKLCEQGHLSLHDKVFGTGGILDDVEFTSAISDKNYYKITVEHLLRHEAGLSIRRGDPLFTTRDLMHIYHLKTAPDSRELKLTFANGTPERFEAERLPYASVNNGILSIFVSPGEGRDAMRVVRIPIDCRNPALLGKTVLVTGEIRMTDVTQAKDPWNGVKGVLYHKAGGRSKYPAIYTNQYPSCGTYPWRTFRGKCKLPENATDVTLMLRSSQTAYPSFCRRLLFP